MLSPQEYILISVIVGALALMLSNRVRPDLVALLVLLVLGMTGIVTPQDALAGFSRPAVITIIGLFIITQALEDTGVVQWLADRIRRLGGGSEARLVIILMAAGALLSLIMNNIAAGAVLLPAAVKIGRESDVRASKLLMPLAFGTLVGGMATLFTTANLVMSSILQEKGEPGLTMLDFLPTGGLIVLAALVFMALMGRQMLPERDSVGGAISPQSLSRTLQEAYQLAERLWETRVLPGSRLVDQTLGESQIGEKLGVTVMAIWRHHHAILAPEPSEVLRANDYLLVLGREERVNQLSDWGVTIGRENGALELARDFTVDLTEVIIPPRSNAIGKTLKDLRFRNKFGLTSVALWRGGRSYRTDVGLFPLEVGDALLMVGAARKIKVLAQERDFLVLQSSHVHQPPAPQKALPALLITALVLLASIFELMPTPEAMLAGALALALTGCINIDDAYRAVEWRVIFLIAGMLPLSLALTDSGLAARVGGALADVFTPYGALALVGGFFIVAMLVTQIIAGQVSALLVGPIAITAALHVGINPQAMAVAMAIACSTAFLTPLGHPVNALMMGPGGYAPGDFVKVGVGMTLVTFVTLLIGMTLFWRIA